MNIVELPSPNFDSREGQPVDMLVLHYTGMKTAADALARLRDAEAKVSAHYVVDEDGTIYRLVGEENRAWHSGTSAWRGTTNINQRSIGIEIVNPGHEFGYRDFPKTQMDAVIALCKDILSRHKIPPRNVVGHSDVAPSRKEDPGELFDWKRLAKEGIGLWPKELFAKPSRWQPFVDFMLLVLRCFGLWTVSARLPNRKNAPLYVAATGKLPSDDELRQQLLAYGYDSTDLPKTILAFQRHFFPERLTGVWDHECGLRLAELLKMV